MLETPSAVDIKARVVGTQTLKAAEKRKRNWLVGVQWDGRRSSSVRTGRVIVVESSASKRQYLRVWDGKKD